MRGRNYCVCEEGGRHECLNDGSSQGGGEKGCLKDQGDQMCYITVCMCVCVREREEGRRCNQRVRWPSV